MIADDVAPPSAELLLYLAEFGDDDGQVEDPIAVDRALAEQHAEPPPVARTQRDGNAPRPQEPAKTEPKVEPDHVP